MIAFLIGASLPPGVFGGEAGRLLTTFLGFVTASILPTISLIVGGMVVGGQSVQHLDDLGKELSSTVDALFGVFGLIGLAVIILMTLAIPTPASEYIPNVAKALPSRGGQGLVCFVGALAIARSGTVPGAIRRSLTLRTSIAVDDARKKTEERGDAAKAKVRAGFATKDGFGRTTKLADIQRPGRDER
ncbi:MAG TPA: hypothetical protein VGR32_09405 [Brevundimonas sp.]|uniref:hypothetical protein n=1 Tax=Brevundimonas sp. TaxID=1871086 RepID=UPI002DEF0E9C|nr:hypothetical protein [Brevundimonas sp.]